MAEPMLGDVCGPQDGRQDGTDGDKHDRAVHSALSRDLPTRKPKRKGLNMLSSLSLSGDKTAADAHSVSECLPNSKSVPFHTAASLLMCKHEHERAPKASSSTPTIPTIYAISSSERVHNSTLKSGLCDACNDERESGKGVLAAELSFDDITHNMSKLGIGLSEALARPFSLPDSREADDSIGIAGPTFTAAIVETTLAPHIAPEAEEVDVLKRIITPAGSGRLSRSFSQDSLVAVSVTREDSGGWTRVSIYKRRGEARIENKVSDADFNDEPDNEEEFLADTATWRLAGSEAETPVSGSTRQAIKASITKRVSNASASLVDLLSYVSKGAREPGEVSPSPYKSGGRAYVKSPIASRGGAPVTHDDIRAWHQAMHEYDPDEDEGFGRLLNARDIARVEARTAASHWRRETTPAPP